ncbi:Folylpolyglutamate synthase like protein [Verticillium longisporum]|nr:Folylpolyglutamate synthase like protein [Verticillium longisporum]
MSDAERGISWLLDAEEHLCALEGRTSARRLSGVRPSVLEALKGASLRGRHEKLSDAERGITWLLDGAHTTDSLEETAKWLAAERQKQPKAGIVLLFNQQEREASELLLHFLATLHKEMGDAVDKLFKLPCREAFASVYPSVPTHITQDLTSATEHISGFSAPGDKTEQQTVLVTGSMHLVGGVIGLLEPEGLK